MIDRIAALCREVAGEKLKTLSSAGIGTPGVLSADGGEVILAANLNFVHTPLAAELSRRLGFPVRAENDANCAALAESRFGAAAGCRNVVLVTLGTGVGGGAILDGRPYREIRRPGSEFGHMITHAGGEPCPCGERGCYERYASSAALVRRAKGYKNAKEIVDAVQRNDPAILPIWESYIEEVCVGLVSLMAIFYPEVISIGGGISASGDFLLNAILKGLPHHEGYRKYYSHIRIRLADFGNDAGVLGAAAAACRKLEKE